MLLPILLGGALGALNGLAICFVPREPNKPAIFIATTLRTALVGHLVASALHPSATYPEALFYGAGFGFLTALIVFLAKGSPFKPHTPLLLFGTLTGGLLGLAVRFFVFPTT
jgi:hypothetical protein